MTAPAPRRWFRLHLSTLLALTLTVAVLMWLNLRGFYERSIGHGEDTRHAGWPVRVHFLPQSDGALSFDFGNDPDETRLNTWLFTTFGMLVDGVAIVSWNFYDKDHLYWWALPNGLVALLILLPVLVVGEVLARRRERVEPSALPLT